MGNRKEIRALAATGILGSGFRPESLKRGLEWGADFIGCDAGSTDFGPYLLGSGDSYFSRDSVKSDLRHILKGAMEYRVPAMIGSAGTAGADIHLNRVVDIVEEIAREEHLSFRLATVHSEQSKEYVVDKWKQGKIKPLANAPELNEQIIQRSARIVGVAGIEPYIQALDNGADVIICGRSSDTSIYASLPIRMGIPPGAAWHMAKIMECGAASVTHRKYPDCMFSVLDQEGFIMEPPNPVYRCTPLSVASHMLYENSSPFLLTEPSGVLDTSKAVYTALSDRAVRVTGSVFNAASQYTVKLEGAELVGYQSMFLGGVRDPVILRQLDKWLEEMQEQIRKRFVHIYGADISGRYELNVRVYGRNGVLGVMEKEHTDVHEVGVVFEITADSEETSKGMASTASHLAVHYPVPEWSGLITGFAYPYSPSVLYRGPVYRFNMNHVVEIHDAKEMFSIEYVNVNHGRGN